MLFIYYTRKDLKGGKENSPVDGFPRPGISCQAAARSPEDK